MTTRRGKWGYSGAPRYISYGVKRSAIRLTKERFNVPEVASGEFEVSWIVGTLSSTYI